MKKLCLNPSFFGLCCLHLCVNHQTIKSRNESLWVDGKGLSGISSAVTGCVCIHETIRWFGKRCLQSLCCDQEPRKTLCHSHPLVFQHSLSISAFSGQTDVFDVSDFVLESGARTFPKWIPFAFSVWLWHWANRHGHRLHLCTPAFQLTDASCLLLGECSELKRKYGDMFTFHLGVEVLLVYWFALTELRMPMLLVCSRFSFIWPKANTKLPTKALRMFSFYQCSASSS